MKINFTLPQINFASMGRVRNDVKQIRNQQNASYLTSGVDHSINPFEDYSMCLTGKEHLKVNVSVSDEIRNKVIDNVREAFRLRGGMTPENDTFSNTKKAYIMSSPSDSRISVGWTLDQIGITEAHRIASFIKEKDPTWDYGKPVKTEILEQAFRPKLDVKV